VSEADDHLALRNMTLNKCVCLGRILARFIIRNTCIDASHGAPGSPLSRASIPGGPGFAKSASKQDSTRRTTKVHEKKAAFSHVQITTNVLMSERLPFGACFRAYPTRSPPAKRHSPSSCHSVVLRVKNPCFLTAHPRSGTTIVSRHRRNKIIAPGRVRSTFTILG
jgi:hypothetical protein